MLFHRSLLSFGLKTGSKWIFAVFFSAAHFFPKLGLFSSGSPDSLFPRADGLPWLSAWLWADLLKFV